MNVLRQETDYALRLIALLSGPKDGEVQSVSTRVLAEQAGVSYEFACKILQKLHDAGLIKSVMGPKGGYQLNKAAKDITLLEVVTAVQGSLNVNGCLLGCERKNACPLSGKMEELQKQMEDFLTNISLEEAIKERSKV
jgi:Rrf2 family protein